jgi:proteasome beta subunit
MKEHTLKTGTTTVGIVCKDGIVIAADKRATSGNLIADKRAQKVHQIIDDIAVTIAGTVSDAQLLIRLLRSELKLKEVRSNRKTTVKEAANLLSGFVYGNVRRMSLIPGISHFLMSGKDQHGFHLYDVYADGSLTEVEDFVSSGSGSVMAYGVLETMYKKDLTTEEGIKLVIKSINAAMQRDSASGNGIDVAVIDKKGYKKVLEKEIITKIEY